MNLRYLICCLLFLTASFSFASDDEKREVKQYEFQSSQDAFLDFNRSVRTSAFLLDAEQAENAPIETILNFYWCWSNRDDSPRCKIEFLDERGEPIMTSEINTHHEKTCFGNQTDNCREGELLQVVENLKKEYCTSLERNQFSKTRQVSLWEYTQKSEKKNNAPEDICDKSKKNQQNLDYWTPLKKLQIQRDLNYKLDDVKSVHMYQDTEIGVGWGFFTGLYGAINVALISMVAEIPVSFFMGGYNWKHVGWASLAGFVGFTTWGIIRIARDPDATRVDVTIKF
ncbi:hypothetical protein B7982_02740 [Fibrobacter sp. UWB2]|uniref:hypothetical protein n=1 Tax=Fibrobacter sp. UWB2 TaxID=1964358 RepID=UPI000B528439|nr:hypothetical protein [Fibrobacter sp. UWB2]OWV24643.1 hypothetical protein B7982_02740 [Fibrobacter sp. UWB2]